jgi:hypothetical protein
MVVYKCSVKTQTWKVNNKNKDIGFFRVFMCLYILLQRKNFKFLQNLESGWGLAYCNSWMAVLSELYPSQ